MARSAAVILAAALFACAAASKCESPKVTTSSAYSTSDGFFHFQTSIIADFALQCSNGAKNLPLYAVVDGKTHIVASAEETGHYQVSLLLEHADAPSKTFSFAIYDEDSYAQYKKDANTKPIATVEAYHAGLARKWPINAETIAVLGSLVAVYFAFTFKSALN